MNNKSKDITSVLSKAHKKSMPVGHELVYDLEAFEDEKSGKPDAKTNTGSVRQDPLEVLSSFAKLSTTIERDEDEDEGSHELETEPENIAIADLHSDDPQSHPHEPFIRQFETDTKSRQELSLSAYFYKYGFGATLKSDDNQGQNITDEFFKDFAPPKPIQPISNPYKQIENQSQLLDEALDSADIDSVHIDSDSDSDSGNEINAKNDRKSAQDDRLLESWRIHNEENHKIKSEGFQSDNRQDSSKTIDNAESLSLFGIKPPLSSLSEAKEPSKKIPKKRSNYYVITKLPVILEEDEDSVKSNEKLTANKILFFLKKLSDCNEAKKINLNANFVAEQELDYGQLVLDDENLKTSCFASCFARLFYRQKNVSEEYPNNATADLVIPRKTSDIGFVYQNKFFIFENFNDQEFLYDDDCLDQQSFSSALEEYLKGDQDQRLKIIPQDELSTTDKISLRIKQNILSQLPQANPGRKALSIERTRVAENSSLAR